MRTTINLDDQLFNEAKKFAVESNKTLTSVIENSLRNVLAKKNSEKKIAVSLATAKGKS